MREAGMSGDTEDQATGPDLSSAPGEPLRVLARAAAIGVRATWALGILALAGITAWSFVQLGRYAVEAVSGLDAGRIAWLGGSALVAAALWGAILWNRGPLRTHPLAVGLLAVLATRLIDVALVPAPLVSDFLNYHQLGVEISQHGPMLGAVPTGYPMALGVVYAIFGQQPVYGQLLNCLIALATAALVYDTTRRLWDGGAARWALWLFALAPAQILMTGVLASEAPYGLLLMFALWLALRIGSRRLAVAIAIGVVLAASNYVRATTPALIPAFAVLPFLTAVRLRTAVTWAALVVVGFLVVQTPLVIYNEQTKGELSISAVTCGPGWSLLVGTDPARTGRYNPDLFAVVGLKQCSPEFDRRAGQIAMQRLRAKPLQFLELAVKKFPVM
jgi:hypothetical protein